MAELLPATWVVATKNVRLMIVGRGVERKRGEGMLCAQQEFIGYRPTVKLVLEEP